MVKLFAGRGTQGHTIIPAVLSVCSGPEGENYSVNHDLDLFQPKKKIH